MVADALDFLTVLLAISSFVSGIQWIGCDLIEEQSCYCGKRKGGGRKPDESLGWLGNCAATEIGLLLLQASRIHIPHKYHISYESGHLHSSFIIVSSSSGFSDT